MKTKILLFIIISMNLNSDLYSQKYRTMEQFQEYFIQNINKLDPIEGLWVYNSSTQLESIYQANEPETVAIIREGLFFKQYTLVNGYYEPVDGYRQFRVFRGKYQYNRFYPGYKKVYGKEFNLYSNKKKFSFKMTAVGIMRHNMKKMGGNPNKINNAYYSYSYTKIFPLDDDITKVKRNVEKEIVPLTLTGTGFAISTNGYIVTNHHVIEDAKKIDVKFNNDSYEAEIIMDDSRNDLAIIKIVDKRFNTFGKLPYTLKKSLSDVGENIFVLGYPLTNSMGDEIKLTNGIISSKTGFKGDISSYQISAPIQPGNSGGPLFDKNGNIIGVVNAKHNQADNAGYAIKVSYLMSLIELLDTPIKIPTTNTISSKNLPNKVKILSNYVFSIVVNNFSENRTTSYNNSYENSSNNSLDAMDFVKKGKNNLSYKNYTDAYLNFSKAISKDPNNVEAYFIRGYLYLFEKHNFDLAISDLTKCIQLKPEYSEAYLYRGLAYQRKEEKVKAIKDFTKCHSCPKK